MNPKILVRILRLAARAVAASAGGFTTAELTDLAAQMIGLGTDIVEAIGEREG